MANPAKAAQTPGAADIQQFSAFLGQESSQSGALRGIVESAQMKVAENEKALSGKVRDFNLRDDIRSLVEASHLSSMNSISVQLAGKVSGKVSEGFEQLVKQQ